MVQKKLLAWRSKGNQFRAWLGPIGRRIDHALRESLPGRCAFCLGEASPNRSWCQQCYAELPWNRMACPICAEPQGVSALAGRRCGHCVTRPPAFSHAQAPLRYEHEVARRIQHFKFYASPRAGHVLLELLELSLGPQILAWPDALVAVPLHPDRARERGFDQAAWLARRLAKRHAIALVAARRRQHTRSQRGLDRSERYRNLHRGFEVTTQLPPRVALLDDVMTTGATLDALAEACLAAGASRVEAWAVARTPREAGYAAG